MKLHTYSSLAAFIAHYDLLCGAQTDATAISNPDDAATLAEMESIIAELNDADRSALTDTTVSTDAIAPGDASRHRARAEMKLRRILVARGLLAG
jgi:hypothetical protein